MAKKVYIATPVNARKEATLEEKRQAAYKRVKHMEYIISKSVNGAEFSEFHSAFDNDIAPLWKPAPSESVIMGKCMQRVMECDIVIMDEGWEESRGCGIEYRVAYDYDKKIYRVK